MKLTIIVTILATITFGQSKGSSQHTLYSKSLKQDTTRIGMIPFDSTINYLTSFYHCTGGAGFTDQDFNQIDSILKESIRIYNNGLVNSVAIDLTNYERQYMFVLNEKGEKLVWVNCFCKNKGHVNWPKPIVVAKGGKCYFNFVINLTKGVHSNPKFNPED